MNSRRRLIIIASLAVLLFVVIVGAIIGVVARHKDKGGDAGISKSSSDPSGETLAQGPISTTIKVVCSVTTYPEKCLSSLASVQGSNNITDPERLLQLSLIIAVDGLSLVKDYPAKLAKSAKDPREKEALDVCSEMIADSMELVNDSLALLMKPEPGQRMLTEAKIDDIRTYLSAALTNKESCLDELLLLGGDLRANLSHSFKNSTEFTSNCLAIATKILDVLEGLGLPSHRKLFRSSETLNQPEWVSTDRFRKRLLHKKRGHHRVTPHVTVAADGTGDFKSINQALAKVPNDRSRVFVIHVKAGTYREKVVVPKRARNVYLIGDGARKTIVTGKRSVKGGSSLYGSASFAVEGFGCMVKGMTIENTAGPKGEQAVAVVVKADMVVFYRCAIVGFQDSLYVHSLRQFYRNCRIVGTVDFIFGDARVVLQNCLILPRQPRQGQTNLITAQGRHDSNALTAISIDRCRIAPFDNVTAPTFLGRPWKKYSRTVVMKSNIDGFLQPEGWRSWDGSGIVPNTLFYGEYMNTGAGANTAKRVNWPGYHRALTSADANKFSVDSINKDLWIPRRVPYFRSV